MLMKQKMQDFNSSKNLKSKTSLTTSFDSPGGFGFDPHVRQSTIGVFSDSKSTES